ncbi:branched-chain amino acid ABC transporter substrate-binding protein [Rhizobium sp. ARZ01]|uniref:branched-chain amino acid ABC transporter substrate-binding protein n=1 Tax=Rhizobium sp. ARZ01 TaxID=2769313 RepID=UPI0017827E51|nr:branched-chain amino acid ABC transporter substrate-binding protein [Rhizobium sp. ARZ01]MBD9372541.1 branched-chain amino acid ABC transporter substrate-binding protein [Rhizobium sp. ARZ01]
MFRRLTISLLSTIALAPHASAAGPTIAVVAPVTGPFAILGDQIREGARFAAATDAFDVVEIGEACDEVGDKTIAQSILSAGATAAIGFLCTEDLQAALPALADAGVPAITLSVRSGVLMEDALKRDWPLFRLAPGPGMEAQKVSDVIASTWAAEPFALIDDGTIHARELVEAIRLKLEEKGMKPVFVDTFRPAQEQQIGLVRRLAKAGATRVFVGGDRGDMAVIVRDARAERLPLSFMGGEAMMAADATVALPDGTQAIVLPIDSATPESAALAMTMKEAGFVAEGYVFPAYAATTLVGKGAATAASAGKTLPDILAADTFPTVLGTIGFGADHELRDNPYLLMEWKHDRFTPVLPPIEGD